jgi:ABC-type long-subunit fatty acid transport system fused permease/ATPase subunit
LKTFILDKLVWPLLAILFFSGVGSCLIFFGHQTIRIDSANSVEKTIVVDYTHEHFWGLLKISRRIEKVEYAEIVSSTHREFGRIVSASSVVLVTDKEKKVSLGLSAGLSYGDKRNIVDKINAHIQDHRGKSLSEKLRVRNVFYWIGLPFLAIGVLGIIGWPGSIVKAINEYKK